MIESVSLRLWLLEVVRPVIRLHGEILRVRWIFLKDIKIKELILWDLSIFSEVVLHSGLWGFVLMIICGGIMGNAITVQQEGSGFDLRLEQLKF